MPSASPQHDFFLAEPVQYNLYWTKLYPRQRASPMFWSKCVWGSLASSGQHFKCLMLTVGTQLHHYPISSHTNLISPTINTELMISVPPHIQPDPNTSSLPKMQLQAVASSSAKNFPADQPGHISKCKCHRHSPFSSVSMFQRMKEKFRFLIKFLIYPG